MEVVAEEVEDQGSARGADQGADQGANQGDRKRGGNPHWVKGGPSPNPYGSKGKPPDREEVEGLRAELKAFRAREAAAAVEVDDALGGEVSAARMKRILGQDESKDVGPTDRFLRGFLNENRSRYLQELAKREGDERAAGEADVRVEVERLRKENAELRAAVPAVEDDEGTRRSLRLLEEHLAKGWPERG